MKKNIVLDDTRELNRVSSKLLVHTIVLLTYPKDHMLFLRLTCVKHVVIILFSFRTFYYILL